VEQYHAMIVAGVLTENDPVELLEGVLVFKMPKNPPHSYSTDVAQKAVGALLPDVWSYRAQEPITLADGEPEPDGAVVRGSLRDYRKRHPTPADIALVIEVADSTLSQDRGIKLRSYARAGIPVYWIINLAEQCVEVYTRPNSLASEPAYDDRQVYGVSDSVSVIIDDKPIGSINVPDLLP
jgi:Uma2 family endonuclease